jgi:hypothetical protein
LPPILASIRVIRGLPLAIEAKGTLDKLCSARPGVRSFAPLRMTISGEIMSELMRAMRAKDEFKLQKDGVGIHARKEEVFFEEIVIVL